jgi:LacI family transcriptional regulator
MKDANPPKVITMRDIALVLGVSHVTVSLALRNHKSIPEHHRLLIQAKAEEMGYKRNAAATTLAHFRASANYHPVNSTVAWLNLWEAPEKLRQYREFNDYWLGASQEAEKQGYRLEEFVCSRDSVSIQKLATLLINRGIEGILLPPQRFLRHLDNFPWEKFCSVRFGRSLETPNLHLVSAHQVADAMLAYRKIKELGYYRIGFISGSGFHWGAHFQGGYTMAQQLLEDTAALPPLQLDDSLEQESYQDALEQWLRKHRPDAIISDVSTIPEMLGKAGCKIPEDVAFAAVSILDGRSDTGINQNSLEIGRVAIHTLISLLHHGARGIPSVMRETLLHGEWVQGEMVPDRTLSRKSKPVKRSQQALNP